MNRTSRRLRRNAILGLGTLLAVALLANAILTSHATKPAIAAGGTVLSVPGGDIHVVDEGPRGAPAVVLLHRVAGSVAWWDGVAADLRRDHRVIRIDFLGHGGSEKPRSGYELDDQARVVAGVLARLRVGHATVAGHSLGGLVATGLAQQHPELVERLALFDATPNRRDWQLSTPIKLGKAPIIGQALWQVGPDGMARDGLSSAFAKGFDVPDRFVRDLRSMTFTAYSATMREFSRFIQERPLDERLMDVPTPVIAIFGGEDRIVHPRAIDRYRRVPGVRVVVWPGIGHTPPVEAPARSAELIRQFVARGERSRAGFDSSRRAGRQ